MLKKYQKALPDSRIGQKFLKAGVGFGGSCFPKDTKALLKIAETVGYRFKLIESVVETNTHQRAYLVKKLMDVYGEIKGKRSLY